MSKRIEVLGRAVHVQDGRLLLCRTLGADHTYLPGGHVEFQERVADAVARELREELDRDGRVGAFLGCVEHTFLQHGERHCELNLVFSVDIRGLDAAQPVLSCENHLGFEWTDLASLEGSDLEPAVLRTLLPRWLDDADAAPRWGTGPGPWDVRG